MEQLERRRRNLSYGISHKRHHLHGNFMTQYLLNAGVTPRRGEYRDESVFANGLLQQWNSGAIDGRTKFRLHVCKLERGAKRQRNPQAVIMSGRPR